MLTLLNRMSGPIASIVGSLVAVMLAAAPAAAMTKATGQANITAKAAANPWVGTPNPAIVYPARSNCPAAGPCGGWYEKFTNWANIYTWDDVSTTRTFVVHGAILSAYDWFSNANGFLGYPRSDEFDTPTGLGRKQTFQGATVYYKWGAPGAFEVHGWIEAKWNALGATTGELGFPTSGEEPFGATYRRSTFEHGEMIWDGVAGSWQADVWPVMTTASTTMTKGTSRWITGRTFSLTTPNYALFGCGFTPGATVTVRANNRSGRLYLGTAAADPKGCFSKQTPVIPTEYNIGGVVTFEADDGASNGHIAVVGLPWSYGDCFRADLNKSYFMIRKEGRATWCVDTLTWMINHDDILAFDLAFPEQALQQIESDFELPYTGEDITVEVYWGSNVFWTPSMFGPGVVIPSDAFLAATDDAPRIPIVQELVNQYTAWVAGFWPQDWWADHKSPFPTFVNWRVLSEMGLSSTYDIEFKYNHGKGPDNNDPLNPDTDPDYVPGGVIWDPQTLFFEELATPSRGWTTFAHAFKYLKQDQISLGDVQAGLISELRSEFVLAYLSLGHGVNLTSEAATTYHVGKSPYLYVNGIKQDCWRQNPGCDDNAGPPQDWTPVAYTPSNAVVTSIADAHCRIRSAENSGNHLGAGVALTKLRAGNYNGALADLSSSSAALCGASCPSECGCYLSHCAAPWH